MPGKPSILITDKDLVFSENLRQSLLNEGYQVTGTAADLRSALAIVETKDADFLLAGISADDPEDGINTAKELLKISKVPLIYLCDNPGKALLRRVKPTTPAAVLSKPPRLPDLLLQIELARTASRPMLFCEGADDVFIPTVKGLIRILLADILFILSDSNYSKMFLTRPAFENLFPGKTYTYVHVNVPMGVLYDKLPPSFYKLSRFELINLKKIDCIGKGHLQIGEHERAIPENGRTSLLAQLRVIRRR